MRYRSENENLRQHIQTLRWVALGQMVLIGLLWIGWHHAKEGVRIHLPPDLRSGAVIRSDEPRPENIYAFARYIFQQLNYWPSDGQQDYGQAIFRLSYFLSPRYIDALQTDLDLRGKRGELLGRARSIQDLPGRGYEESRVRPLGNDAWVVTLEFRIYETVRGVPVKTVDVRYPIRVQQLNTDPDRNPWGLVVDGFAQPPTRIEAAAIEEKHQ